jgi:sulfonate transport system substrate-binding protein
MTDVRSWSFSLVTALIALTASAGGCRDSEASRHAASHDGARGDRERVKPLEIHLDYATYNPSSLVLKHHHWLEDDLAADGIAVRWVFSQGSNKANELLASGSADVVSTAGAAALLARTNGVPTKIVYVYSKPEWTALVVGDKSPIASLADLKGKKIAATRGTDAFFFLLRGLATAGLGPDDVEVVHLQHADGRLALARGDVDAWAGLDPFMASAELREHARLLYRNIAFNSFGTLDAREDFLAKYPELVERVIAGYERARVWILAHPQDAAALLAEESHVEPDVALRQLTERTVLDKDVGVPGEALRTALAAVVPILTREKLVGADKDRPDRDRRFVPGLHQPGHRHPPHRPQARRGRLHLRLLARRADPPHHPAVGAAVPRHRPAGRARPGLAVPRRRRADRLHPRPRLPVDRRPGHRAPRRHARRHPRARRARQAVRSRPARRRAPRPALDRRHRRCAMTASTMAISAVGVGTWRGGEPILHRLDLAVWPGEIVSVIGPSGCGKSTLLRLISGLERDHTGELRVAGHHVQGPSRAVGFMFQEPRLLPWLTVRDNVALGAPRGQADTRARVDDLLAQVQLTAAADALPHQLSGGMAQRTALARALVGAPDILLLDEPFSAVDAITRASLQDLVLAVWARTKITLLLVTHDLDEALYVSDRVLVLSGRPATVTTAVAVDAARPRDRHDPALARQRAPLLKALHHRGENHGFD